MTATLASNLITVSHELVRGFWSFLPHTFFLLPLFKTVCLTTKSMHGDVFMSSLLHHDFSHFPSQAFLSFILLSLPPVIFL